MARGRETSHGLRHGQALALQYAAQVLINLDRDPRLVPRVLSTGQLNAENAAETALLGCDYAARIILPFTVEVALKALVAKHNDGRVEPTHHLCQLHDALPRDLRDALSDDFEKIKFSEMPEETRFLERDLCLQLGCIVKNVEQDQYLVVLSTCLVGLRRSLARSLRQVLIDHDNDVPDWRYLDDAERLVAAPILTLQYVASSVLNVYNST